MGPRGETLGCTLNLPPAMAPSAMALSAGELSFCLLPCAFLLLLSLALRCAALRRRMATAAAAVAQRVWVAVCVIMELPLDSRARCGEAGAAGTDASSGRRSGGPQLICKPTALAKYLLRNCGALAQPRLAAWPRGDPHLQTVSSLLLGRQRGEALRFAREHLLLTDGGVVAVDWAVGGARWEGRREHPSAGRALGCFTATPPVLILVPQSWGGMTPHLKALCRSAQRRGFYVAVFHHRATAGCPMTTTRMTEFGDPADLEQVVAYVRSRHPSSKLVAVSEGSGSGVLLSYLGECGSSCQLTAAAAISPVLMGQLWFETPMPPIYRWGALFRRKMQLSRYSSSFRAVLDVDRALSSSSLRDFEETLFCSSTERQRRDRGAPGGSRAPPPQGLAPSAAWALGERARRAEHWEGYWERNEPLRDADEVAVPVLCIRSRDDPLLPPASALPLPLFQRNPYFLLVLMDGGGHCGFALEGGEDGEEGRSGSEDAPDGNWSHVAVMEYFRAVADFLKGEERGGASHGAPPGEFGPAGQRSRTNNSRRSSMMRRARPAASERRRGEAEGETFTWRRCYTR